MSELPLYALPPISTASAKRRQATNPRAGVGHPRLCRRKARSAVHCWLARGFWLRLARGLLLRLARGFWLQLARDSGSLPNVQLARVAREPAPRRLPTPYTQNPEP